MPTHMPVLVDFWCIGDNPGMPLEDAWSTLAALYATDDTQPIVIKRPDHTLTYVPDHKEQRITLEITNTIEDASAV